MGIFSFLYLLSIIHSADAGGRTMPPASGTLAASGTPSSQGQTWCVANENVGGDKLQAGLEYACGDGGADCGPIQPGSSCFKPNKLEAHASYAFNSYYQKNGRAAGSCDFDGAAYVVDKPPQYGACEFPTGTSPINGTPPPSGGSPSSGTTPTSGASPSGGAPPSQGQSWCVAKTDAASDKLQAGLEFACGPGGADCSAIQPGSTCYNPNSLEAHASYAFNSYYQKMAHAPGSCNFQGAAYVVNQPPQYGQCEFPTGTSPSSGMQPTNGTPPASGLPPSNETPPASGASPSGGTSPSQDQSWCVAKTNAASDKLQAGLEFACGPGGADCSAIQPGSTCYNPNSLEAHASYAFNSYYQKMAHAPGSCNFEGAANIVNQPPQYGQCEFPTGTSPSSGTQPANGTPPASGTSPSSGPPPANGMPPDSKKPSSEGQSWCVAKANADPGKLTTAMEFACGQGGVDCGPIQPGGTCYDPNVLVAHASYAFNNYYQKKAHAPGSCDFDGTAQVVDQVPQFGNCILKSGIGGGTWHGNGTMPNTGTPLPKDQTWCVANGDAGVDILTAWLKFGCWKGWADCSLIQPGTSCYNDNSLVAQISYVFNGYYQKKARAAGSCDFAGAAYMTSQRPQYGDCEFTTESGSSPAPASGAWFSQGRTWCLASKSAGDEILLAWIKYACDKGLADCKSIQEDGFCYDNNSTITHASYTLNSYYEKKGHAPGTCDFGGAAYIITQPPQYGECQFTPGMLPINGTTWCVAKKNPEGADEWRIQKGLKYACGEGKADCAPIQPGGKCYNPNTLEAHASYAFNSYYQMRARDASACNFNGVGQIVNEAPKYGECEFPTYYTTGS